MSQESDSYVPYPITLISAAMKATIPNPKNLPLMLADLSMLYLNASILRNLSVFSVYSVFRSINLVSPYGTDLEY
tara:strand:+ start:357 stop:581 length:225 start_codon:yes stop_codon:yes gene_type:complete